MELEELEEVFTDLPDSPAMEELVASLMKLRAGIYIDPLIAEPWRCDPERCRPLMGRYLCCKVQTRCSHFDGEKCSIHDTKPYSCALFPIDLVRVGGKRLVLSALNPILHGYNWSRYDRDMLRCFEGDMGEGPSMLEVQLPVLERAFTRAELQLILNSVEQLKAAALLIK